MGPIRAALFCSKTREPHDNIPVEQLSDRELEVFQMLGQGRSSRQIAEALDLTIPTFHSFGNRIKEKLRMENAPALMRHANQWVSEHDIGSQSK